jgi:hypothetical protein
MNFASYKLVKPPSPLYSVYQMPAVISTAFAKEKNGEF